MRSHRWRAAARHPGLWRLCTAPQLTLLDGCTTVTGPFFFGRTALHARPIGEDDFVDLALREAAPPRHNPLFHHTTHFDYWWR